MVKQQPTFYSSPRKGSVLEVSFFFPTTENLSNPEVFWLIKLILWRNNLNYCITACAQKSTFFRIMFWYTVI